MQRQIFGLDEQSKFFFLSLCFRFLAFCLTHPILSNFVSIRQTYIGALEAKDCTLANH